MKEPTFALCWVAESWNPGLQYLDYHQNRLDLALKRVIPISYKNENEGHTYLIPFFNLKKSNSTPTEHLPELHSPT